MPVPDIPDRMCASEASAHYSYYAMFANVTIDNVKQVRCTEYCISEGWAICTKLCDGKAYIDTAGNIATETIKGAIGVTWSAEAPWFT